MNTTRLDPRSEHGRTIADELTAVLARNRVAIAARNRAAGSEPHTRQASGAAA
jgi:hypothetical protein